MAATYSLPGGSLTSQTNLGQPVAYANFDAAPGDPIAIADPEELVAVPSVQDEEDWGDDGEERLIGEEPIPTRAPKSPTRTPDEVIAELRTSLGRLDATGITLPKWPNTLFVPKPKNALAALKFLTTLDRDATRIIRGRGYTIQIGNLGGYRFYKVLLPGEREVTAEDMDRPMTPRVSSTRAPVSRYHADYMRLRQELGLPATLPPALTPEKLKKIKEEEEGKQVPGWVKGVIFTGAALLGAFGLKKLFFD